MNWYILEPRDPLMVRDGRPFGLDTEGARSLDFPPPSVVAGALRTRIGFAKGDGMFNLTPVDAKRIAVLGPLLVELSLDGPLAYFAAPRDAVLFDGPNGAWTRHRLAPTARWEDGACSLPDGLLPVGGALPKAKPAKHAPTFWTGSELQRWLAGVASAELAPAATLPPLPHEVRTHVAIDPTTGTGVDGKLFQTDGLRFEAVDGKWSRHRRLGLAVACDDVRLVPGLATVGGERRLSNLTSAGAYTPRWSPPRVGRRARLMLLTPALFAEGAVPSAIAGAVVRAAAVGRPAATSGWDMELRGPKAVRRLAPAGSVYWVELPEGVDGQDWADRVHFAPVSDQDQDRCDGFGLAAVGVW
jgi:CRISPR-associated protein Cmr3